MSVQSEINRISGYIQSCYTAVSNKNGLLPMSEDVSHLAVSINSILTSDSVDIPRTFRKLDFIESTGTQWIDMAFKPSDYNGSTFTVEAKFMPTTWPYGGNGINYLFGRQTSSGRFGMAIGGNGSDNTKQVLDLEYGGVYYFDPSININTAYTVVGTWNTSSQTIDINGSSYSSYGSAGSGSLPNQNVYLFARYVDSASIYQSCGVRLYYFNIKSGSTYIRKFVPVIRLSDSAIGLYDKVANQFFSNSGTGTFLSNETYELPIEYRKVEYIQSSGTQYINTGVNPVSYANKLWIEADMAYVTKPTGSSTQSYLFGTGYYASNTSNRRTIAAGYRGGTSTTLFSYIHGAQLSNAQSFSGATLDTNRHIISIDQTTTTINNTTKNRKFRFDDKTVNISSSTTITSQPTNPILIFCGRNSGSSNAPINYYSSAKLWSFKIFNSGILLRYFIPCIRESDDVPGLYDIISKSFYTNAGTGTFTAANPIYYVTVTDYENPWRYTLSGAGEYTSGSSVTISSTPTDNALYSFSKYYGNYGISDKTTNPFTFTVTEDVDITPEYNLNISGTSGTIQYQINRITAHVADAYKATENKGGTIPSSKVIANLPTAINSIPQ